MSNKQVSHRNLQTYDYQLNCQSGMITARVVWVVRRLAAPFLLCWEWGKKRIDLCLTRCLERYFLFQSWLCDLIFGLRGTLIRSCFSRVLSKFFCGGKLITLYVFERLKLLLLLFFFAQVIFLARDRSTAQQFFFGRHFMCRGVCRWQPF